MNQISCVQLALALSLLFASSHLSARAATKVNADLPKHEASAGSGTDASAESEKKAALSNLDTALKEYKETPSAQTWQPVWTSIKSLVLFAVAHHADPFLFVKTNPGLVDLGLHLTDSGSVKTLSFPKTAESKEAIVVFQEGGGAKVAAVGRGRAKRVVTTAPGVTRAQALPLAPSTNILDARIIATTAGGNGTNAKAAPRPTTGKALVLLGSDRKTGSAYLGGYKMADGRFVNCPELLSGVPPFLLQCMQGKIAFVGNGVVLTADAPKVPPGSADGASAPSGGGYKISLIFSGDHYVLDNKSGVDPQTTVAMQFLRAVQSGRVDLVKAWLADPKLASIPGYLGLYNRADNSALKLVPMAPPPTGNARFRLVTYAKDDLILDIGKVKSQWAVKGLFIAPPDPLAKKLAGTIPRDNKGADKSPDKAPD